MEGLLTTANTHDRAQEELDCWVATRTATTSSVVSEKRIECKVFSAALFHKHFWAHFKDEQRLARLALINMYRESSLGVVS